MTAITAPILLAHHRQQLAESGIAPEVIAARGYRSVDTDEARSLGFAPSQCRPGLLIPSMDPSGTSGRHQLRPDRPRPGTNGKPLRYETPAGVSPWLDVNPRRLDQLTEVTVDLWLTEGAKKSDALVSAGFCAVALQGVWSWRCLSD